MGQAILMFQVMVTIAYMLLCSVTDIREREIYVFPCWTLIIAWGSWALGQGKGISELFIVLGIHLFIYGFFRFFRIWGDGDSDVFVLFGFVFWNMLSAHNIEVSISLYVMIEMICFVVALLVSLQVGLFEALIKKHSLRGDSSVAVVPGFACLIIGCSLMTLLAR